MGVILRRWLPAVATLVLAFLPAVPASAQVNCAGLTAAQCTLATGQYTVLQSFQSLPNTSAGLAAMQSDLSTVVGIYQNATVGQRNQAALNYVLGGFTPQYNIWSQISPSSQILSTLQVYPQLQMSGALAGSLASQIQGQGGVFADLTTLLGGSSAGIGSVQQLDALKDSFTAYATAFAGQSTQYANSGQNDPRPFQIASGIANFPWTSAQAGASAITNQQDEWGTPGAGNGFQQSGGFPSGHSTIGETTALLYAMMLPQAYQSMMVSGQQFGLSRNILGVHHPLDVIGARVLTYYTMTQLMAGNADYALTGVASFPTYVQTLAGQLASTLGSSLTAVPYASCASNVASCIAASVFPTAAQFAAANQAYANQSTYGLPAVGATNLAAVVPTDAELLIGTRFPYLSAAQRREVLATTELPSGGPLDDGTGWVRLNLFKAAGGYGAFNSSVSVTLDASLGGFNAVDMWSNDISGSGGLTKNGSGLLILGGNNSFTGGTTVAGGTLALTGTMVGDLTVQAGASFVSGGGYSVAAGRTLTNAGTFQSVNGALVNAGTIDNSGSLLGGVVNNGTFNQTSGTYANSSSLINNSTFNGNVNNTGTLGGNGTFNGAVANLNIVAPGNSIGTLTVNGSFTQAASGSYRVETDASGAADRINVTGAPGTATINGGTVAIVGATGVYQPSTTYTIINATGGVTGRFTGVTSAFPFLQGSLSYDSNNAFLTLKPGGFAAGAATANQIAVGVALDRSVAGATGDFATVVGTLATATRTQGQAAMSALSGQNYAAFSSANLGSGQLFMNVVGRQMDAARGGDPGNGTRIALADACEAEACAASPWSLWGAGLAGFGSIAGDANAGAVTYSAGGVATGIDYRVEPRLLMGLGVGFASGSQWVDGLTGRGTTDSYQASLYASFTEGDYYADALAGFAYNVNRMTRQIAIAGLTSRTANGNTGASQLLGQIETGYRFGLHAPTLSTIAPFVRLQGMTVMQNGFTENGAGAIGLSVASQTTHSLRSTLGAELSARLPTGAERNLGMLLRLGWSHEFADTTRPVTASFVGAPGSGFTVLGAQPARDSAVLALAADLAVASATSLFLRYDGEVGSGSDAHGFTAGIRMTW